MDALGHARRHGTYWFGNHLDQARSNAAISVSTSLAARRVVSRRRRRASGRSDTTSSVLKYPMPSYSTLPSAPIASR